jgi:RNA polymerase sigma factor (sigma-70 family)
MAAVAPELPVLVREQAFENLYRSHVKDVYHYALALLRNPADAEDVTQTTFLNAYRAWQRGQEVEKPRNWLIKIAHNVARTRYARASRRVKEVPLDDHLEQLSVPVEDRPNIEGVLQALGRLPFNQRAALVMRELEGRSYSDIADTIGVSVPAVETLIFRARKSLRLRASELRALVAVPLPNSLTRLFENGETVAAGGGAVVGMGLLVKATIALLAGAIVTGVGGNQIRPATAASNATVPDSAAASARHPARTAAAASKGVRAPAGAIAQPAVASTVRSARVTEHAVANRPLSRLPAIKVVPKLPVSDVGAVAQQVSDIATSLVNTVEETLPAEVSAASAVPAVISGLPAALPNLPPRPKLP